MVQPTTLPPRRGFTLLEIVIAVSILAILAGLAVPMASKAFESRARNATRAELDRLAEAVATYFEDVLAFPAEIDDLWIAPRGATGWTGPYVPSMSTEALSGDADWNVDAWALAYEVSQAGDVLTLTSGGSDRTVGTADDLAISVDATPIRRARTLAILTVLNQAIQSYNATHLPEEPLPTSIPLLLQDLVGAGLLPTRSGFEQDAWGDPFVPVPPGESPVVAVGSVHVGATGGSSSGGGSGSPGGSGDPGAGRGSGRGPGGAGPPGRGGR